jgi:tRNA dimethylallyltransferase
MRRLSREGRRVLVVGGSGFYLKSFFQAVTDGLEVDGRLRRRVEELYSREGLEGVLDALDKLNPNGSGDLERRNPRRVVRALERCLASGKALEELADSFARQPEPFSDYEKICVSLVRERDDLRRRVEERTRGMLQAGLLDEVRSLLAAGIERNPSACGSIGYRESIAYLKGESDRREMEDAINHNTMRLIKKQMTWIKKQVPVDTWIDLTAEDEAALARLMEISGDG